MPIDFPNEKFLTKTWVQTYIKQKYDESVLWEKFVKTQPTDALSVLYYQEKYIDIETPNDAAMSAPIDTTLRSPNYRSAGGLFPTTEYSRIEEKNAALYQLAMQGSVTEEAKKYTQMEAPILRIQRKIGNAMASDVNMTIGNELTETWAADPTNINDIDIAAGKEWSLDPTTSGLDPVGDVLTAVEAIEDLSGYNYNADVMAVSKQSWFDLRHWASINDYEFGFKKPTEETRFDRFEGLRVLASNQIKRDFCVVMDSKEAMTLYEAEGLRTHTFFDDYTHKFYFQAMRTIYPALTDPKSVSLISNTVA